MADFSTWRFDSLAEFAAEATAQLKQMQTHIDDLQQQVQALTREARDLHFKLGEPHDTRRSSESPSQTSP